MEGLEQVDSGITGGDVLMKDAEWSDQLDGYGGKRLSELLV
jgi:hypothetical protein